MSYRRSNVTGVFVIVPQYPLAVANYFKRVLKDGQPYIDSAEIKQSGEMRLRNDKPWLSFNAHETIYGTNRSFFWEATIPFAKIFRLQIRDSYSSGTASSKISIFSIPISKAEHSPELNYGALMRYLGESVWIPTALLHRNDLIWNEVDDQTAIATLHDADIQTSLEFHFNDDNEITRISTQARYRLVGKKFELTPWIVRMQNYKEVQGVRIPFDCEVEWILPQGSFLWFRASLVGVKHKHDEAHRIRFTDIA